MCPYDAPHAPLPAALEAVLLCSRDEWSTKVQKSNYPQFRSQWHFHEWHHFLAVQRKLRRETEETRLERTDCNVIYVADRFHTSQFLKPVILTSLE